MRFNALIFSVAICLLGAGACQTKQQPTAAESTDTTTSAPAMSAEAEKAQQWLAEQASIAVNADLTSPFETMKTMCTPQFVEFKQDALNDQLSDEAFAAKWGELYDLGKHRLSAPFIACDVNTGNKIDITVNYLRTQNEAYFFEVVVDLPEIKTKCSRTVKVLKQDRTFAIDDVTEIP